jgi:VWFA-related protein
MSLISSDATEYPLVHAYVRVEDAAGNSIPGMSAQNFVIQEQLQGGQYLMAEISQAEVLNQNAALNTSMVVDKSGSISEEDMGKIKTVMTQFVDELQFTSGDKAEIISIDDIVRQMCLYTSNAEYLKNGINSMFPEGMTAFYDGVYQGIQQSLYQVGARCVIAFTDGLDNASVHSYQDVINYATAYSVPVYIIGVGGSVDEATLRLVAESTGGQYWYIDDLYSLEEIYRSIYKEQKEMYQITYTSRSGLGASDPRMMRICAVNDQYIAVDEEEVTPYVVDAVQIQTHASRYELVRSDASWEQASQEALAKGGHLVTISSQDEMNQVTQIAQNSGLTYVWLGGYTSYDANGQVFGHWTTGEPFTYQNWCAGEPSRTDKDGVQEWYIMLWNIPSLGGWNWNDQRNDPAADYSYFKGKMGYIIEYEE